MKIKELWDIANKNCTFWSTCLTFAVWPTVYPRNFLRLGLIVTDEGASLSHRQLYSIKKILVKCGNQQVYINISYSLILSATYLTVHSNNFANGLCLKTQIMFIYEISISCCVVFCPRKGLPENCNSSFQYGRSSINSGTGFNGTYATHILLKEGTNVIEIPPQVTDRAAVTANWTLPHAISVVDHARRVKARFANECCRIVVRK